MEKNKIRNRNAALAVLVSAGLLGLVACSKKSSPSDGNGQVRVGLPIEQKIDENNSFVPEKEISPREYGEFSEKQTLNPRCKEKRSSIVNPEAKAGEVYSYQFSSYMNKRYSKSSLKIGSDPGPEIFVFGSAEGTSVSIIMEKSESKIVLERVLKNFSATDLQSPPFSSTSDATEIEEYTHNGKTQGEQWSARKIKELKVSPEFEQEAKLNSSLDKGDLRCSWVKSVSLTNKLLQGHFKIGAQVYPATQRISEKDEVFSCNGVEKNFKFRDVLVSPAGIKTLSSDSCYSRSWNPSYSTSAIMNTTDNELIQTYRFQVIEAPVN